MNDRSLPVSRHPNQGDLWGALRRGPEPHEPLLEWLCRVAPNHDYARGDIERVYTWVRARLRHEHAPSYVWASDVIEHVDSSGRPSMGLFLAWTAAPGIDLAMLPMPGESSLQSRLERQRRERVQQAASRIAELFDAFDLGGLTRCQPRWVSFSERLDEWMRTFDIKENPHEVDEETIDELAALARSWPETLRHFPADWVPTDLGAWPDVVRAFSSVAVSLETETQDRALARTRALDHITSLSLFDTPNTTKSAFFERARFEHVTQLRITNSLSDHELVALAQTRGFGNLTHLELFDTGLEGMQGIRALIDSGKLGQLESLRLESDLWHDEQISAIARSSSCANLRELALGFNLLNEPGLLDLINSPHLRNLEALDLQNCELTPRVIDALCESTHLEHLRVLDLQSCTFEVGALAQLGHTSRLPGLRHLDLKDTCYIGEEYEAFLDTPLARQLDAIYVDHDWWKLDHLRQQRLERYNPTKTSSRVEEMEET